MQSDNTFIQPAVCRFSSCFDFLVVDATAVGSLFSVMGRGEREKREREKRVLVGPSPNIPTKLQRRHAGLLFLVWIRQQTSRQTQGLTPHGEERADVMSPENKRTLTTLLGNSLVRECCFKNVRLKRATLGCHATTGGGERQRNGRLGAEMCLSAGSDL